MSIRLLKTLVAISETGSFAAAAEKICISQAAIGQQMKRLEEEVRVALFDRSHRTPQMTDAARALVPKARELISAYDQVMISARMGSPISGEITIGAVPSLMASLVPRALSAMYERFPGLRIRVVPGLSASLYPLVDRGAVDAAIMSEPPSPRPHLNWQRFASEELMVICSRSVQADEALPVLTSFPYIRMARHAWISALTDEILDEAGLTLHDTMELESLESIATMVSHNIGVAIVPRPCVPDAVTQNLRFLPIGNPPRLRELGILSRRDIGGEAMIQELFRTISETIDAVNTKEKL